MCYRFASFLLQTIPRLTFYQRLYRSARPLSYIGPVASIIMIHCSILQARLSHCSHILFPLRWLLLSKFTFTPADSFGLSLYPISLSNKAVIDNDFSQRTLLLGAEQKSLSKLDFYWCLRFTGLSCICIAGAVDLHIGCLQTKPPSMKKGIKKWALVLVKYFNEFMWEELVMRGFNTLVVDWSSWDINSALFINHSSGSVSPGTRTITAQWPLVSNYF